MTKSTNDSGARSWVRGDVLPLGGPVIKSSLKPGQLDPFKMTMKLGPDEKPSNNLTTLDGLEIPPYPRKHDGSPRGKAEFFISSIDARISKLATLGLRPHPNLLDNRAHCQAFLEGQIAELEMERFIRSTTL